MTNTAALSRAWDAFDGYLFDIDGTLLNCRDAVHYFAFCDALSGVAGRPLNLDGVVAHGNVDEGILRDAFNLAAVDEAHWRAHMPAIREQIGAQVEQSQGQLEIEVLPGAAEVLQHLRERGARLSTATGNLTRVGEVKLAHCGLKAFFHDGGYSDGCETREAVFGKALAQLRSKLPENAAVCVVGDTPSDIRAAHAHGLEVIALTTGIYSREQLEAEGPELCVDTLKSLLSDNSAARCDQGA